MLCVGMGVHVCYVWVWFTCLLCVGMMYMYATCGYGVYICMSCVGMDVHTYMPCVGMVHIHGMCGYSVHACKMWVWVFMYVICGYGWSCVGEVHMHVMGENAYVFWVFFNALPTLFYKRVFYLLNKLTRKPEIFSCLYLWVLGLQAQFLCGSGDQNSGFHSHRASDSLPTSLPQVFSRKPWHFKLYTTWFMNVFVSFHIPDKVVACLVPLVIIRYGFGNCTEYNTAAVMEWTAYQENLSLDKTRRLAVLRWTLLIH